MQETMSDFQFHELLARAQLSAQAVSLPAPNLPDALWSSDASVLSIDRYLALHVCESGYVSRVVSSLLVFVRLQKRMSESRR